MTKQRERKSHTGVRKADTLLEKKFRQLYGEDHIYSKIWNNGLTTKLKDGTKYWHDPKVISNWMKRYMETHKHDSRKTFL